MSDKDDKLNRIAKKHGLEAIYVTYCINCGRELYLPVAGKIPYSSLEKLLSCSECGECRKVSKQIRERVLKEREEEARYTSSYDHGFWEMSIKEFLRKLVDIFRKKRKVKNEFF